VSSNFKVLQYSISELKGILADNSKASIHLIESKIYVVYFEEYFDTLKARTIIVEYNYVDRDFLEDFAAYYVRCFPDYKRYCTRIHFFDRLFTEDNFKDLISASEDSLVSEKDLQDSYLGFVIVKPLPKTIIGRTCLRTYPKNDAEKDGERFFPIIRQYNVNLFGVSLNVETLAFQEQDQVAAACATSALWSVFQGTGKKFQHSIPSPVKITEKAFQSFPLATRAFPNRDGLTAEMMAQAIRDVGLEPFSLNPPEEYIRKATLYAYLRGQIPILLIFTICKVDEDNRLISIEGKHAVAVTGFHLGSHIEPLMSSGFLLKASQMDKIYVHDDQVGPFSRMSFDKIKISLEDLSQIDSISTSWGSQGGHYRAAINLILIPLYHKIRIPFEVVFDASMRFDNSFIEVLRVQGVIPFIKERLEWDIYLITINDLKSEIFNSTKIESNLRLEILSCSLPHFIWRATATHEGDNVLDLLFDATDIEQSQFFLRAIEYDQELSEVLREIAKAPSLEKTFQTIPEGKIIEWFKQQSND